jgi:hypothetical protein
MSNINIPREAVETLSDALAAGSTYEEAIAAAIEAWPKVEYSWQYVDTYQEPDCIILPLEQKR